MEKGIKNLCLMNGGELVFKPFLRIEHFPAFHMTRVFIVNDKVRVEYNLWDFHFNTALSDLRPSAQEDIFNAILWDEKLQIVDRNLF